MKHLLAALFLVLVSCAMYGQPVNYDESKVPEYTLPDVMKCKDGSYVTTVKQWEKHRRLEVLDMLSSEEYGYTPQDKVRTTYELVAEDTQAFGGSATMQQVLITFSGQGKSVKALLLALIPNHRKGKVPVFIGYNFKGNHSICDNQGILYSPYFKKINDLSSLELQRNTQPGRWPLSMIIERGYAVVTMCYHDIFPDNPNGHQESVTTLFPQKPSTEETQWQAIGAWAWGNSRMADWVARQSWANRHQLIVIGHSRQGKAALWAGAQDKRFSVVISNDSGCGGAALSRRQFGERVENITKSFPHWFCPAFSRYAGKEQQLPFDQHELLALIAPRHLYVASAQDDLWADPRGEYLSAYHASPVYQLYGLQGLTSPETPQVNHPVMNHIGYHIRSGQHDVTDYDWTAYMDFCDKAFSRSK